MLPVCDSILCVCCAFHHRKCHLNGVLLSLSLVVAVCLLLLFFFCPFIFNCLPTHTNILIIDAYCRRSRSRLLLGFVVVFSLSLSSSLWYFLCRIASFQLIHRLMLMSSCLDALFLLFLVSIYAELAP